MATPTFNNTEIARIAGALWGSKLGSSSMSAVMAAVNTNGLSKVVNDAYNASFGGVANATVAATVVANLGITGANAAPAVAAVKSTLDGAAAGNKGAALVGLLDAYAGMTADPTYGAYATDFNSKVASALTFSQTANTVDSTFVSVTAPAVTSFNLTTGVDSLTGSAGDDAFTAYLINQAPTLQSGDVINGGAGNDTIYADLAGGNSSAFTPILNNIETIKVRGQLTGTNSADNNVYNAGIVDVDAERTTGFNRLQSDNSRADVMFEDVRIGASQITKDITIAMVQTDPGHVDYAVYFDQPSLRAATNSSSVLNLELMDTRSADAGLAPLKENPFNGFRFKLGEDTISVASEAIDAAQTYDELLTAVKAAVAANPSLGNFTVSITGDFTARDTVSGHELTGKVITLKNSGAEAITVGSWTTPDGSVPSSSGLHTNQTTSASSSTDPVTSTIILDDVGRGSTGGDLVIGGLSVGETSTSRGVDRFEITVERSSKLEVIASTNNALKEVSLVNGTTKGDFYAKGFSSNAGNLANGGTSDNSGNNVLPGLTGTTSGGAWSDVHGQYGFTDVRLIDGSAMTGKVTFDAQITNNSYAKYINPTDTAPAAPAADTTHVVYSGGTNNDSITVDIDGAVAGSQTLSGLEDFDFTVNGNAGNDAITVRLVNTGLGGGTDPWYTNQAMNKNIFLNGGEGNDTVNTLGAGDSAVDLGAGDDTFYSDNTGNKAVWVYNSADQTTPAGVVAARNIADLVSDTNETYNLYKGVLQVSYKDGSAVGIQSTKITVSSTGYKTSDLQINQAIKQAINTDPVLSKLLIAKDGPSSSLVVTSLIDGVQVPGALSVSLVAPASGVLTAAEVLAAGSAYGIATPTEILVLGAGAGMGGSITTFGTNGDYATAMGNNAGVLSSGSASAGTSDNVITGGAGMDVIVLDTTDNATAVGSSNETVVYAAAFGNDTIVHFQNSATAGLFGDDKLNFKGIGGSAAGGVVQDVAAAGWVATNAVDGEILLDDKDTAVGGNDTVAKVIAKFVDNASATAVTQVYVVVDSTNIGSVYKIVDAAGGTVAAPNVTAELMGTIDLADTLWSSLVTADFS